MSLKKEFEETFFNGKDLDEKVTQRSMELNELWDWFESKLQEERERGEKVINEKLNDVKLKLEKDWIETAENEKSKKAFQEVMNYLNKLTTPQKEGE